MDMWNWLQPWWNWWAWFTGLFEWDALAAISTTAAVILALQSSQAAASAARRKALATLDQALAVFATMAEWFDTDDGYLDRVSLELMTRDEDVLAGIRRMETISHHDWADTRVAISLDGIIETLKTTRRAGGQAMGAADSQGRCPSFAELADFDFDHRELFEARRALRYGIFKTLLPVHRLELATKKRKYTDPTLPYSFL